MTITRHRRRRNAELHHVLPAQDQDLVTAREAHVFHARAHSSRIVGSAALVVIAVLVSSSTFWAFVWWDDVVRQNFFPRRGPGTIVMSLLFSWGLLTQIVGPLRIVRALQESRRLRIALSLKLVACWTATALFTIVWWIVFDVISGWFALLAGGLFLPAGLLLQTARVAIASDE